MPEKLPMWEDLRQYFKDESCLDTSREGPRMAMNDRSSSLSGHGIDIPSICTIGQVFLTIKNDTAPCKTNLLPGLVSRSTSITCSGTCFVTCQGSFDI
ncbi:hypothetical protein ACN38_g474 [Penicillium nordicum]|uniref:Uncharacterized protein n=1 Tax=Penicillium nordicum TaxID=229535 RepID=A0A0M9WKQ3_9EURO|nr:hypothetical protein ACN38_g474 [Penicillium nordicum]